jgi:glycosyltransferase involved in cell wall biosynthesis
MLVIGKLLLLLETMSIKNVDPFKMLTPFFSIITPSYNQGKYLSGCLDSIRRQTNGSYEHIVIDNCSTDETKNILVNYAQDPRVRLLVESDHGQSNAVNKGFRMARGEVICWLNSDDAYFPETLEKLQHAFQDPTTQVIFGDVLQVSYNGEPPLRAGAQFKDRRDFIRWWSGRIRLHQPAVFFRSSVRERIGFLKEDLHYAMDYEYWWRMSEFYHFHCLGEELAIQHRQPDSKTIQAWYSVLEEREKIFSPFYPLLEEKKSVLDHERSDSLAHHFLIQAYAVVQKDRHQAWFYFRKALRYAPFLFLKPSAFGLIRQLFFYDRDSS